MRQATEKMTMHRAAAVAVMLGLLTSAGCSNMSQREQRVLSGAGIGAAAGTAGAALTGGNVGTGAVLGTAAGAGAGYLYDKAKNND